MSMFKNLLRQRGLIFIIMSDHFNAFIQFGAMISRFVGEANVNDYNVA